MLKQLGLLYLVTLGFPLAAPAAETCKPVPFDGSSASPPGLALSANGGWLAAAGPSGVDLFQDPVAGSMFSVHGGEAVSIHGGRLAVGGGGAVSVYQFKDNEWKPIPATLDAPRPGARFGASVALGDRWLVVGAPEDGAFHEGAAYVYSAETLRLERILRPGDGRLNDRFGASVAVDGNTFVVGAPYADDLQVFYNFGAVYVFETGTEPPVAKLRADRAFRKGDIQFGAAVAIRGDSIVAGAPGDDPSNVESAGSAHLFHRSQGAWSKAAELTHPGPSAGRQLGTSVAVDEAGILVGALGDGSAYFFKLNGNPDGECACGGRFGRSVALWTRDKEREAFLGDTDGVKGCFKIREEPKPVLTCEFESPPASAPAGATATYTIRVRNEGTAPADPARLEVATTPGLGTGVCKPGGCSALIPAGERKRFRVTFALPPACEAPGSIQPRASVWTGTTETKCSLPPPTRIERASGVQGRIEGDGQSVLSGKEITYRLRLENNGPGPAPDGSGPELEHSLPPELVLVDQKILKGGGTLKEAPRPSGDPTGQGLLWDGAIPLCGTVELEVTARVPYDQGQVEETVCLEATVRDRDGRRRPVSPYCFRIVPYPEITPSGGR